MIKHRKLVLMAAMIVLAQQPVPVSAIGVSQDSKTACESSASISGFASLADRFYDHNFKRNPNWATNLGIHHYDHLSPDLSKEGIAREVIELKDFLQRFEALKPETLSEQDRLDRRQLISYIKARLLDLESVCFWQRNPDFYSSESNAMIFSLLTRDFTAPADLLERVISREKHIPYILHCGKNNLINPPRIYTEVALEQIPGMISFFESSVPEKFKTVDDKLLLTEFQTTNAAVVKSLKDYQKYLKETLLPKSNGEFALGTELYRKKLDYEEMVDMPLDQLLAMGEAELKRLQKDFETTARQIDSKKTSREVFVIVSSEHPAPDKLIASTAAVLEELKEFCRTKNIVTFPSPTDLRVDETPPFMRALSFASMDAAGPFEEKATQAYYYVTVPETNWKPERIEEHMRAFCKYDILNISVHEAYPGHYVQGLWRRRAPSKTSKIMGCGSNAEGWAHYSEQMMVDQGLMNGDKKLKLIMLHDALLRCCRYIVAIKLHTQGMSMPQAIDFFMQEGYQEKANAERETKRGTMDPTYLVYTLGKLQILALREEYKKQRGKAYSLEEFHDRFLATGCPPIKMVREMLLSPAYSAKK